MIKQLVTSLLFAGLLACPAQLRAAARSVIVTFSNQTNKTLVRVKGKVTHGRWKTQPPKSIPPKKEVRWKTESNGVLTGTEGSVTYRFDKTTQIRVAWDNPYTGGNSYEEDGPEGYYLANTGGAGHDAKVKWTFRKLVIPPLPSKTINSLAVRIVTSTQHLAGSDNTVFFDIGPLGWKLPGKHGKGSNRTHSLNLGSFKGKLSTDDILWLRLQKKGIGGYTGAPDGPDGEWKPKSVHLIVNGAEYVRFDVNRWLKKERPTWRVVLRPNLSAAKRFAHALRLRCNGRLDKKDKISAILTTPLAKKNNLSGWIKTNLPIVQATGKVVQVAVSLDRLATIDIRLEKIKVGSQEVVLDGKHGVRHTRFLRVEYEYTKKLTSRGNPLPKKNQRVRIGGHVVWDSDDEWWYEIHPRNAKDVVGLK